MKKAVMIVALVSALMLIGIAQVSAQTINGCVNNKTGTLRISATCTRSESPISWNQTGSASAGAVQVYDANENYIGVLVDGGYQGSNIVFIPTIGKFVGISTEQPSSANASAIPLYFKSADCTGTPYFPNTVPLSYDAIFTETLNVDPYQVNYWQRAGNAEDGVFYSARYAGVTTPTTPPTYPPPCVTPPFPITKGIPLTAVASPFAYPVAFPLQFR